MDGQKIWEQRQKTEDWLSGAYYWQQHFVKTSEHPAWRGKVKCRYCKANGWPENNKAPFAKWWGDKHGESCKWKELYDLKNRSQMGNLTYSVPAGSLYINTGYAWQTVGTTTTSGTFTI